MDSTRTVAEELAELRAVVESMNKVVTEFLIKRPTRKVQAKQLGVAESTLWRRAKRAKILLMANGRI